MYRLVLSSRFYRASAWRRGLFLVVSVCALYALLPNLGSFHNSFGWWRHATWSWVGLAVAALAGTYLAAAGVYALLAAKRLRYYRTVVVQVAAMFANRLLPAGIGALGVNYDYLRRNGHTSAQAGAVIVMNNVIGLIGHLLLLAGMIIVAGNTITLRHLTLPAHSAYWLIAASLLLIASTLLPKVRRRLQQFWRQFQHALADYWHQPRKLLLALGCSLLLTSLYLLSLYCCSRTLGAAVTIPELFISLTLGVAGGTATPTPGGLGGAEAGLVGGLVLCGLDAQQSLEIVLLYRLVTYWSPLILGGSAFILLRRRHYI